MNQYVLYSYTVVLHDRRVWISNALRLYRYVTCSRLLGFSGAQTCTFLLGLLLAVLGAQWSAKSWAPDPSW